MLFPSVTALSKIPAKKLIQLKDQFSRGAHSILAAANLKTQDVFRAGRAVGEYIQDDSGGS